MKLEAIAVLVTRHQTQDHGRTPGNTGFTHHADLVGLGDLRRIQVARGPQLPAHLVGKGATDTLRPAVHPHDLLGRAIELLQTLTYLAGIDPMPDLMGGKAAAAFVDECSLEILLLLGLGNTLQPILGFGGVGGLSQPSAAEQQEEW